jgi:hypothetical protein
MRAVLLATMFVGIVVAPMGAQTPQPIPRPGGSRPPATTAPPAPTGTAAPAPAPAPSQAPSAEQSNAPTAATLGFPLYPTAQFIASYDAGRGQRYYLFGTVAAYSEVVAYYRAQLRDKGDVVYEQPPTHMFLVGRFRDETMAFPPGVTVKDWTWGGSPGYPNPKLGADPARYPSVIMIVPAPAAAAPAR